MAEFEGNFEIEFDKSSLTEDRQTEFEQFVKNWGEKRDIGYTDWYREFDFDEYESALWGANTPENIEDIHSFMKEAAKRFNELEAKGEGDAEDVMTGSWSSEYSFYLSKGQLDWKETMNGIDLNNTDYTKEELDIITGNIKYCPDADDVIPVYEKAKQKNDTATMNMIIELYGDDCLYDYLDEE